MATFGLAKTMIKIVTPNVIEIGLLFPGSVQTQARKFPSSDIMSALKVFQLKSSILSALVVMNVLKIFHLKSSISSALVTSLGGKNRFSMERLHSPKPREQQTFYFNNVGYTYLLGWFLMQTTLIYWISGCGTSGKVASPDTTSVHTLVLFVEYKGKNKEGRPGKGQFMGTKTRIESIMLNQVYYHKVSLYSVS